MTNSTEQTEIELLLPFYVNGTLDDAENKLVEEAITDNKDLRQELVFLQSLQSQVQQHQGQEHSPGELGLKRLQKILKAQQTTDKNIQKQALISTGKNRWQFAAMAACLMLVVQTVSNIKPDSNIYIAAGGNTLVQHEGEIISITFSPDASEQQIRRLFLESNIFIVDGPSALGVYRLSISTNIESTISTLQARTDLIESVQQE